MKPHLPKNDLHPHIWDISPDEHPTKATPEAVISYLLRYAILAPSVHNTQPWLCSISKSTLILRHNPAVKLRDSDPTARETYISFGAFVANFVIAAQAFGHSVSVEWLPSGYTDLAHIAKATITLSKNPVTPDLQILDALRQRRNYRGLYKNQAVDDAAIKNLGSLTPPRRETALLLITDPTTRKKIAELMQLSATFGFSNTKFRRELSDYIVPNTTKREDGIPGYASNIRTNFSSQLMPHVIRHANIGPWQGRTLRAAVASAPVLGCITGADDSYHGWLQSGYYLQEVLTQATALGLSHSIWAALIELPGASVKLQRIVGSPLRPHVFFGLGHVDMLPRHSARKPVSAILEKP